jgi:uncharacterized membrane protein
MSDAFTAHIPPPLPEPTQDERTMAVLAHVLQLVGGWIAPLIIFFVKPDSKFVRFHALQVLLLHIFVMLFWFFAVIVWIVVIFAGVMGSMAHTGGNPNQMPPIFFAFPFVWLFIWLFAMIVWLCELILAIMYAIKVGRGEWAEYPLFGRWAKRILKVA